MNYFTTAQWAQIRDMSVGDMEECLMERGYQTLDTRGGQMRWRLTEKGLRHAKKSWNPFNQTICWDFEALFDVVKYYGRKTRRYFYCEECGAYMNDQNGFDTTMDKWVCKSCGVVNDLAYVANHAAKIKHGDMVVSDATVVESLQKETMALNWKCPKCSREAHDVDEIISVFGFLKTPEGKLMPQKYCKECRGKK